MFTRPHLGGDRVIVTELNVMPEESRQIHQDGEPAQWQSRILEWDLANRSTRRLDPGLGNEVALETDYPWVLVQVSDAGPLVSGGSDEFLALWKVDTNETWRLEIPVPGGKANATGWLSHDAYVVQDSVLFERHRPGGVSEIVAIELPSVREKIIKTLGIEALFFYVTTGGVLVARDSDLGIYGESGASVNLGPYSEVSVDNSTVAWTVVESGVIHVRGLDLRSGRTYDLGQGNFLEGISVNGYEVFAVEVWLGSTPPGAHGRILTQSLHEGLPVAA
jgi:hypothetical protein